MISTVFRASEAVGLSCSNALEHVVQQCVENRGKYWFDSIQQHVSSVASNTVEENWSEWVKPTVYKTSHPSSLPYPDIVDNTEGIAGFHDLPIPNEPAILLDIGGGKSDSGMHWLNMKYPALIVHVIDPFARSAEHNHTVQEAIEAAGGADIVTSISVLNVIQDVNARIAHIVTVHDALRKGGIAFFKVWAGSWPVRGTGKGGKKTMF